MQIKQAIAKLRELAVEQAIGQKQVFGYWRLLNGMSNILLSARPAWSSVPPTGIEPVASALGKPRSIQLSYEGGMVMS